MSLVDEVVVRRSGAALTDAEQVLLGNIYGGSYKTGHLNTATRHLGVTKVLLGNPASRRLLLIPTRFVLGVTEVLCCKGLPIRVFWVRRKSRVQVCAEHVHDDLGIQNINHPY